MHYILNGSFELISYIPLNIIGKIWRIIYSEEYFRLIMS